LKEKALSCAGLRDLRLTFSPAWLRNFVAACGFLARSTAAYGGFGVYVGGPVGLLLSPAQSCTKWRRPPTVISVGLHSSSML